MNDTDKILDAIAGLTRKVEGQGKAIEGLTQKVDGLEAGQKEQGKKLDILTSDVSRIHTIIKVLPTKGDMEAAVDAAKTELKADIVSAKGELKADILNLDAKVVRKIQRHDRRIENIEEHDGIENPEKN